MNRFFLGCTMALALGACSQPEEGAGSIIEPQAPAEPSSTASLHDRLVVFDSHLDTPAFFHNEDYTFSARGVYEKDGTQVDLPRMNEGGLDGGFWVIYTNQGPLTPQSYASARNSAVLRQMAIREFAAKYADEVELAFAADDADRIIADGKKVVFQSMENAYPLGEDISALETYYIAGLRMIAPVHFANNQFADSATSIEPAYDGLSPLGEELVREANRLGLILDGSHASDDSVRDMMALSTTPIILSHSGPKAIYDHPRNLPDDLLLAIAEDGGVIQVNALGAYLEKLEPSPERQAALEDLNAQFDTAPAAMTPAMRAEYRAARIELEKVHPAPRSSFEKFMEHMLYMLELVGPDHVGMGADWDGGGGVVGMSDVAALPRVSEALLEAGYTEEDLAKIWSGNMMRLMREVEAARAADVVSPDVLN